jgi:hypothetical protein
MTPETKQPMTDKQWAAMDFEPWTHNEDEWEPPTDKEWADGIRLPTVRLAWHLMHKTKAELVAGATKMEDKGVRLIEGFAEARELFERFVGVLQFAEVRLICAGTAVELKEARAGEEPVTWQNAFRDLESELWTRRHTESLVENLHKKWSTLFEQVSALKAA